VLGNKSNESEVGDGFESLWGLFERINDRRLIVSNNRETSFKHANGEENGRANGYQFGSCGHNYDPFWRRE
jgi:hypothetical protein